MSIKNRMSFLALVFLMSHAANAAMDFVPLGEMAAGQSLTGASVANESVHSNPAGSAFTGLYSLDASFLFPRSLGVSVVDTRTSGIGGALGYYRTKESAEANWTQGAKLGINGKLNHIFGMGFMGKMIWGHDTSGAGKKLTDGDGGIIARMDPVEMGLTVRNIFGGNQEMNIQREWALGGRITYEKVLFASVTATSPWGKMNPEQWGFGVEYVSPYSIAARGGFRIVPGALSRRYWSMGISIVSTRLSLHYAVQLPQQAGESVEHFIGTTLLM